MSQVMNSGNGGGGGGLGFTWIVTFAPAINIVNGYGYIPMSGLPLQTFRLPVASAVGDSFAIAGESNWRIIQGVGQIVEIGNMASTPGLGGSWSSTNLTDMVIFVCIDPNTVWKAVSVIGMPAPI